MNNIRREKYLSLLMSVAESNMIKAISGIRRCGKSTILDMHALDLEEKYGKESVFILRLERPETLDLVREDQLSTILKNSITEKTRFLLFDEIQEVEGWEKVINAYNNTGQYSIVITGSNSKLLSSELSTYITGRYIQIHVETLSYQEFLLFKGIGSSAEALNEYIQFGGFPAVVLQSDDKLKQMILSGIADSIIVKDIMPRLLGINIRILNRIIRFLSDRTGSPVAISRIVHSIKSAGFKISTETVENAIKEIENSFFFYRSDMVHVKGLERFGLNSKYYPADTGIINLYSSVGSQNLGQCIEALVYLKLKGEYEKIAVGRLDTFEVDFVAQEGKKLFYYQVTTSLLNESTAEREFRSLLSIKDNWPKTVISLDQFDFSKDGIIHQSLEKFLLS